MHFKGQRCSGGKHSKKRITGMAATPLERNSQCLRSVSLPKQDASSMNKISLADTEPPKKTWMDGMIFEECLRELDQKLERQGREIIIIVDSCLAHPEIKGLISIDLQFLPPNTTSCTQPMDQGVIRYFVFVFYFLVFFKKFVLHIETAPRSIEEKVFFKKNNFYKNYFTYIPS